MLDGAHGLKTPADGMPPAARLRRPNRGAALLVTLEKRGVACLWRSVVVLVASEQADLRMLINMKIDDDRIILLSAK